MPNKLYNIFEQGHCIDKEMMISYVENQLNNEQRNRVERHCLACEMCNDALDGYLNHDVSPSTRLNKMEGNLHKTKSNFFYWYVAASIVLLIGLFTVFDKPEELVPLELAEHKEVKESKENAKLEEASNGNKIEDKNSTKPSEKKEFIDHSNENEPSTKMSDSNVGNNPAIPPVPVVPEESFTTMDYEDEIEYIEEDMEVEIVEEIAIQEGDVKIEEVDLSNNDISPSTVLQDEQNSSPITLEEKLEPNKEVYTNARTGIEESIATEATTAEVIVLENLATKKVSKKDAKRVSEAAYTDLDDYDLEEADLQEFDSIAHAARIKEEFEIGVEYYQAKSYQKAIQLLDKVVRSDTSNMQAANYLADSYVQTQMYKEAIKMYQFIETHTNEENEQWESKWNQANVFILMGKKGTAKKLLTEISAHENPYKEKAISLLKML